MTIERRMAVAVTLLCALALVSAIVIAQPSNTTSAANARHQLLTLAQREQQATWYVDYDFVRVLSNGQRLTQHATEANRPPVHVDAAGGAVTVDFGTRIAQCTSTSGRARCSEQKSDPSLANAEVYRVVIDTGAYTVARRPDQTIVGERAHCYRLQAKRAELPSLGNISDLCFASDGVPLRAEMRTAGSTDTRVALRVQRQVTNQLLDGLLRQLDQKQAAAGR